MKKVFFILFLIVTLLLCSCSSVTAPADTPVPATPEPVCRYAVLAVKSGSDYASLDYLVSYGRSSPVAFSAEGRCKLATGVYCELKDIICEFDNVNYDVLVCFEEDLPSDYIVLTTIDDLPIWEPETEKQAEIYSQLENEIFA